MKLLLILVLLLSGCKIKSEPEVIVEEEKPEVVQEPQAGDFNDFVVLKEGIVLPQHDFLAQDYYSNSLALYKDNSLIGLFDLHGQNHVPEGSICSVHLRSFFEFQYDPLDPANLTMTCDQIRYLYAYGSEMKSIVSLGPTEVDYPWGVSKTLRVLYINEQSTIVKEVDLSSYLDRRKGDPLIIKNYERTNDTGITPVYEVKVEPTLIDDVLRFDLTGRVGYVTYDSLRPDILGTIKFDGVGADSSTPNGLVTVVIDNKIGLADKEGNMVVEAIYDPVRPMTNQIFSNNFQVLQVGSKVDVLNFNNYITDYQNNAYFISDSSNASGFRPVKKDGKVGFLDEQGQELDTFYFDDAYVTHHNRAWVKKGATWSIIELGKDIGYQQQELIAAYNQEPQDNELLAKKFEEGDFCKMDQSLYRITSEIGLYVRDADNMDSGHLGVLNYNQRVCGIEKGDWIEFEYQGVPGYLYKEYTELVKRGE